MGVQIVMDHTGDTRHEFDPANAAEVTEAMQRFNELVGNGYTAAERTGHGEAKVTRAFNPSIETTVFFGRLVSG